MTSEYYEQLFQALPYGLINLNHAGRIVSINRSGADMLGESVEYLQNMEFHLFLHADSLEIYRDNRILAVDRNEVQSSEIVLRGRNGSTIYTNGHFIPIHPDASTAKLILCLHDVGRVKALESQLGALRIPDRKLLHDLNNVFAAISGYAELSQMKMEERAFMSGEDLAVLRRYMKEIRGGMERGEELISQNRKQHQAGTLQATPVTGSEDQLEKRILIIDDEEPIVRLLEELMLQQGYQVACFTRSPMALQYYRENVGDIDLVLLDHNMPELSGIQVATEMMTLRMDQPIILCTGSASLIQDQQSGKNKIRYFASKPIDISDLLGMVAEILQDGSVLRRLSET